MITRRDVVRIALALPFIGFARAAAQEPPRLYVIGLVRRPGAYPYTSDMTVGDAIDAAGGFVPGRRPSVFQIVRMKNGEKEIRDVSMNDAVLERDTVNVAR